MGLHSILGRTLSLLVDRWVLIEMSPHWATLALQECRMLQTATWFTTIIFLQKHLFPICSEVFISRVNTGKRKKNFFIFNILNYITQAQFCNACKMLFMGNRTRHDFPECVWKRAINCEAGETNSCWRNTAVNRPSAIWGKYKTHQMCGLMPVKS